MCASYFTMNRNILRLSPYAHHPERYSYQVRPGSVQCSHNHLATRSLCQWTVKHQVQCGKQFSFRENNEYYSIHAQNRFHDKNFWSTSCYNNQHSRNHEVLSSYHGDSGWILPQKWSRIRINQGERVYHCSYSIQTPIFVLHQHDLFLRFNLSALTSMRATTISSLTFKL